MACLSRPGGLWCAVTIGCPHDCERAGACGRRVAEAWLRRRSANAGGRGGLARLAEEQAALRRVATLVARGAPPHELFAAVTEEVGRLLGTHLAGMARYESDDTLTVLATWAAEGEHPLVPGPW